MTSIKVAHFVREFLRPTETFIANQIRSLGNNGKFTPVVYAKKILPNTLSAGLNAAEMGGRIHAITGRIDDISYKYFRRLTGRAARKVTEELEGGKIELLHFHYLVDARYFLKIYNNSQIPAIVSGYGWDVSAFPEMKFNIGRYYLKPLAERCQLFMAMSENMKADMLNIGIPAEKIVVHYHGIDIKRFMRLKRKNSENGTVKILFCASLYPKKAPDLLLRAVSKIKDKNVIKQKLKLNIVGDGPMREQILKMIGQLSLTDMVSVRGHIDHESASLLEEYSTADIFALPSREADHDKEGIPGTLIEAMGAGLPVVTTYHAGIPEVVKDGLNGILIAQNDPDALAQKIEMLASDAEMRRKLGSMARTSVTGLSLEIKTRELEDIYLNVLTCRKNNI